MLHVPGSHADAIRELEDLQGKRDVALAVASSLVQLHKAAKHKGLFSLDCLCGSIREITCSHNQYDFLQLDR